MAKGKPKRKPFGMNSSLADATQVMRQLPVSAMLSSIEMQINILQERGVEIRDWENNRITESRDGKDHAECDEDHGFFTNGLHGTEHTGIQTH